MSISNGLEYIEIIVNLWTFPVNYGGEYYYRSGSTKQQLRGNALTNFLMAKTGMKRAAALCFYRVPEKVIGGGYVKIGKFEGSELLY